MADLVGVVEDGTGPKRAYSQSFKLARGETATRTIAVVHADDTPYDLTGAAVILTCSNDALSREATVDSVPGGTGHLPFVVGDTVNLPAQGYGGDVWLEVGGNRYQIIRDLVVDVTPAVRSPGDPVTVPAAQQPLGLGPAGSNGAAGAPGGSITAVASGTVASGDLLVEGGGAGRFKVAPLITYNGLPYATPGRRIRGVATSSATDGQALTVQLLGARATVNVDSNFVSLTAPIGALVSPSNFFAGKAFPEQEVDGKFVPSFGCVGVLLTAKQAGQTTMDVLLTKISTMPGASLDGQQTGAVTPWALDPEYGTTVMVQGAGNGALVVQLPDNSGAAYTGLSWYIFDADGTAGAGGSQTITIQSLGGTLDTALATAVINTARGGRRVVGFTDGNFTSGWRVLPQ